MPSNKQINKHLMYEVFLYHCKRQCKNYFAWYGDIL